MVCKNIKNYFIPITVLAGVTASDFGVTRQNQLTDRGALQSPRDRKIGAVNYL